MGLVVGAVLEGKVTGITGFGAFVSLPEGKSGMVHISEVANSFVSDIKEFIKEGDTVRVKVIGIDDAGRINLSIKRAQENPAQREQQAAPRSGGFERRAPRPRQGQFQGGRPQQGKQPRDPASLTFEDKLRCSWLTARAAWRIFVIIPTARAVRADVNDREPPVFVCQGCRALAFFNCASNEMAKKLRPLTEDAHV